MSLRVTVINGSVSNEGLPEDIEVEVDYVSFVNGDTFGPPPLIAPAREGARASAGEKVLYVNTHLVPLIEVERLAD